MRLFRLFFRERFRNFNFLLGIIFSFSILTTSCSTSKESSYAYMDDIYYPGYSDPIFVEDVHTEEGEAPSNVPGAAYVYQPIPEPSLEPSQPYTYIPYSQNPYTFMNDDPYLDYYAYNSLYPYNSGFSSPYFYSSLGFSFSNYYGGFYSPYNPYYYNNYYYSGGGSCPSGGSSSQFITKRFTWDSDTENNFDYLENLVTTKTTRKTSGARKSGSRKSTFTTSRSSSESKSNSIWNSNSTRRSSNYSDSPSRSNSNSGSRSNTRSSSSSRSSSGSYNGKRVR